MFTDGRPQSLQWAWSFSLLKDRKVFGHSSLFDVAQELSMLRLCQQFKDQGSLVSESSEAEQAFGNPAF